ncbi:DUF819 family protein [Kineobactrum salinum]|uniref:DUF819 family protein n=1 Tax=Kineobactrum salinum TaxID=2708301 RepID=A0A6C0U527_9GAMM|nr:DUF819 family protein [Kineobactrum salinum]QIB66519.1 DUF819 family protein [Kineobactrum salinum]
MTVIEANQTVLLGVVIVCAVAASVVLERWRFGKVLSSALIAMMLGMLLVNVRLIPDSAPFYGFIYSSLVPIALPLFLYEAEWKRVATEAGQLAKLFAAGAVGVLLGAMLAALIVDVGENSKDWASVFAASYVGGTVNFLSVATSLELPEKEIAVALAVDTIAGMTLLAFLLVLPVVKVIAGLFPQEIGSMGADALDPESRLMDSMAVKATSAAMGLAVSVTIYVLSRLVAQGIGGETYLTLIVTAITLVLANAYPQTMSKLRASYGLGVLIMLAFFFIVGVSANLHELRESGLDFVLFIATIIVCHLIAILSIARIFGFRLSEAIVVSCACAMGPTVAAGVAGSKRWINLVTPGIVLGIFGYATANFLGLALARTLGVLD